MTPPVMFEAALTVAGVAMAATSATASASAWRDRLVVRRLRALRPPDPSSVLARVAGHPLVGRCSRSVSQRATARRSQRELLDLVDRMVRGLRSGHTPIAAAREASVGLPISDDLVDALNGGHGLAESADLWARHQRTEGVGLVALALRLAVTLGGSSAAVLDGVALSLRDRLALEREVGALSSQARASMVVLVTAPVVALVLGSAIDRRLLHVVVATPLGWGCLALGAALDVVGALWMRQMVRTVST